MRLIDADALYNGSMKEEYFDYVAHDSHGRESFAYSCAMQRVAEAPTIAAIPVTWLEDAAGRYEYSGCTDSADVVMAIIEDWKKEQEV